jgi:fluoride exporter
MNKYWMVGIGGLVGSVARFWLGGVISQRMGARFPYGTFVINCTGCFLIGLVMALIAEKGYANSMWRYLIVIGFLGGYTTFSSFEYETFRAVQDSEGFVALLNAFGSLGIGFLSVWLGAITGRAFF